MVDNNFKILALVGARSGSKSTPNKSMLPLAGKPLLAWPIEVAKASKRINRVILSTDSEEYAKIGNEYGAETPFLRPTDLAEDTSVVISFVTHALDWLKENENYEPDIIVTMLPTTPLQKPEHIDLAIEKLISNGKAESIIICSASTEHPRKQVKVVEGEDRVISYITESGKDVASTNRQSYAKAYQRESLPIISKVETIKKHSSQTGDYVLFQEIPQENSLDVNTPLDFFLAEQIISKWQK